MWRTKKKHKESHNSPEKSEDKPRNPLKQRTKIKIANELRN